jgi:integrase
MLQGCAAGTAELRLSLRTKDKKEARYRALRTWISMREKLTRPLECELEADLEFDTYKRGKALLARNPGLDPHDRFALEELGERLPLPELRALVFAYEHDERVAAERRLRHQGLMERSEPPAQQLQRDRGRLDGPLSKALERFLEHKATLVKAKTHRSYVAKCELFSAILAHVSGDRMPAMSDITAQRVQHYADTIRKLPKNYSLSSGKDMALRGSPTPIDVKTRNFHFATIKDFFQWAQSQHYDLEPNLGTIFGPLKTKSGRRRVPFTRDDLHALFHSEQYKLGTFTRSSDFWIPLLGLFTGAREAELCQLHVADVYRDEATSLWVIEQHDKTLKSGEQNVRKIPVHSQLVRLGFVEFVELARSSGGVRLFADEERNSQGEFSAFSKRFNRYKQSVGVGSNDKTRKDFHSFRHNVSTFLVDHACPDYVINSITGHSQSDQSLAVKLYAKGGVGLKRAADWIAKLNYGLDWSLVRKNGWRKRLGPCRQHEVSGVHPAGGE